MQFPVAGGGAIGVATPLKGLKLGEPATLSATVVEATLEVLKVTFDAEGAGQAADLARSRLTFA
jgi:hypothetical protein